MATCRGRYDRLETIIMIITNHDSYYFIVGIGSSWELREFRKQREDK